MLFSMCRSIGESTAVIVRTSWLGGGWEQSVFALTISMRPFTRGGKQQKGDFGLLPPAAAFVPALPAFSQRKGCRRFMKEGCRFAMNDKFDTRANVCVSHLYKKPIVAVQMIRPVSFIPHEFRSTSVFNMSLPDTSSTVNVGGTLRSQGWWSWLGSLFEETEPGVPSIPARSAQTSFFRFYVSD